MNEIFASIKAFIEKVNLIILLLSLAVSILVYNVWIPHFLWAVFAFCLAYPCIAGIHKLIVYGYAKNKTEKQRKEKETKQKQEEQEREKQAKAKFCTIFESLSEETKKGLIMLYRLPEPEGGLKNSRILKENCENFSLIQQSISMAMSPTVGCEKLIMKDSPFNHIYYIELDFYKVLEEKSKTFEI